MEQIRWKRNSSRNTCEIVTEHGESLNIAVGCGMFHHAVHATVFKLYHTLSEFLGVAG